MTSQHSYPPMGGGFGNPSSTVGRGVVLVLVAVALGVFLLGQGLGDSDSATTSAATGDDASSTGDDGASGSESGDEGSGAEGTVGTGGSDGGAEDTGSESLVEVTDPPVTDPPVVTRPPNEVKVAVVNGSGAPGVAGAGASELDALGYVTAAKNALNFGMEASAIYYLPGYGDDAKVVADALAAPVDILEPAPDQVLTLVSNPDDVSDFHIFVVVASDNIVPIVVG